MNYDFYNREERYACFHLFRLLHEPADEHRALREFLRRPVMAGAFRIYAEVALIRDAYYARKPDTSDFMNDLVRLIARQESISLCRLYTELPEELCNGSKTHPSHIRKKAAALLDKCENTVYGSMQAMFNAKPDLAICIDDDLLIYEAKLTLDFDSVQLQRTRLIGQVWAQLLFRDLGYATQPNVKVLTLSQSKFKPDVSWEEISYIANTIYGAEDRSRAALAEAARVT